MIGVREQLLDIESKTQYQPSRWSSVTHIHTAREPKLHWLAEVRNYLKIYEDRASVSFVQDALSTLYLLLDWNKSTKQIH